MTKKTTDGDLNLLQIWLGGGVDLTERLSEEGRAPDTEAVDRYQPRKNRDIYERNLRRYRRLYNVAATGLCLLMALIMIAAALCLPSYSNPNSPTVNEVPRRYVEQGTEETGAVNTVAGMILDYRAFDTLGESFVLFTAMCTVTILMDQPGRRRKVRADVEIVHYGADLIVRMVCSFLIPIIFVFGIYILLNGHLSPGGGFSGGAILATAPILYAMVFGDNMASHVFSRNRLKAVTVCSLSFYCLAKSYSFYTGANHLHSIITPGTPGRIFSGGLILPLNVAVGFLVCCTMYSFYMYFRRGEL